MKICIFKFYQTHHRISGQEHDFWIVVHDCSIYFTIFYFRVTCPVYMNSCGIIIPSYGVKLFFPHAFFNSNISYMTALYIYMGIVQIKYV